MVKPLLRLHLLAHPESPGAMQLCDELRQRFVAPPVSGGIRIPVFFTPVRGDNLPPALDAPDGLTLDDAEHSLVVLVGDAKMVQTIRGGTGKAWIEFASQVRARAPLDASAHHLMVIALDPSVLQLSPNNLAITAYLGANANAATAAALRRSLVTFHIAARALQLLKDGKIASFAPDTMKAPVKLFMSHAKDDLDPDRQDDPVSQTLAELRELPVDDWYDAQKIASDQDLTLAIQAGIRESSIVLAFQTDRFCERPWCRREVLAAKRMGAHVLIVNAVKSGEARSFPYGGNVPTVRWQYGDPAADARNVINAAVLEALRLTYNQAVLERVKSESDIVVASPPEALTLTEPAICAAAPVTVLYSDPPLGREELEVLAQLRPECTFVTPLTRRAQLPRPAHVTHIAVSISESQDAARYGLSADLFDTLTDELHLYLLLAGLKIVYGGGLTGDMPSASNFTRRLFGLVRGYSKLADSVAAPPLAGAIVNIPPWPLRLTYGAAELALFTDMSGAVAEYQEAARPPELTMQDEALFTKVTVTDAGGERRDTWALPSDTPVRRYAWSRGMSLMRDEVTALAQARVVVGGKLVGFSGVIPGVVEEAYLSLKAARPLYLVGGFGGAARAVSDQLQGIERPEFSDAYSAKTVSDYVACRQLYADHGNPFVSMRDIGALLEAKAGQPLSLTLNNGLTDDENAELIRCTDAQRASDLLLTGLTRL